MVIGIAKFSHCFATTEAARRKNIKDLKTDIVEDLGCAYGSQARQILDLADKLYGAVVRC